MVILAVPWPLKFSIKVGLILNLWFKGSILHFKEGFLINDTKDHTLLLLRLCFFGFEKSLVKNGCLASFS